MNPAIECRGRVVWFSAALGYGFIRVDNNHYPDAFFHYSQLWGETAYKTIKRKTVVKFKLYLTRLGPMAKEVEPL